MSPFHQQNSLMFANVKQLETDPAGKESNVKRHKHDQVFLDKEPCSKVGHARF